MSDRDDGGPAFPGGTYPEHPHHPNGMSLRDWFAGQALAGIASCATPQAISEMHDGIKAGMREAKAAYAWADAMMKARK